MPVEEIVQVAGVNGDTGGKSARKELDPDRIAYLRKINKQTLEVLQQKRHTLEGLFSQKLDAGQSNQGVYHSDKGFSDDDDQGDSSDDETAWITAAKRERFGYCAWRVKRCLMKQGFHVAGTREDYGYRPWLVRGCVEGKLSIKDRMTYLTPSALNPPSSIPLSKKGKKEENVLRKKEEGFWAPTNAHCRITAALQESEKACLREVSRGKVSKAPYAHRITSSMPIDKCPPTVVGSGLNGGAANWRKFSRTLHHTSAHFDPLRGLINVMQYTPEPPPAPFRTQEQEDRRLISRGSVSVRAPPTRPHTAPHSRLGENRC